VRAGALQSAGLERTFHEPVPGLLAGTKDPAEQRAARVRAAPSGVNRAPRIARPAPLFWRAAIVWQLVSIGYRLPDLSAPDSEKIPDGELVAG
jgi:hypothetical protein